MSRALACGESGSELTVIISHATQERKSLANRLQTPDSIPAGNGCPGRLRALQSREVAVWPSHSQRHRKRKVLIPPNKPLQGSRNDKNVRCRRQLAGAQTAGAKSEGNCHFLSKGFCGETPAGSADSPRGPGSRACSPGQTEA